MVVLSTREESPINGRNYINLLVRADALKRLPHLFKLDESESSLTGTGWLAGPV